LYSQDTFLIITEFFEGGLLWLRNFYPYFYYLACVQLHPLMPRI
jgi:hypothetical protein